MFPEIAAGEQRGHFNDLLPIPPEQKLADGKSEKVERFFGRSFHHHRTVKTLRIHLLFHGNP